MNLCRLAPVAYWEALFPTRTGVNWTAAASDLFSRQAAVGMFDPDRLRGRGVHRGPLDHAGLLPLLH